MAPEDKKNIRNLQTKFKLAVIANQNLKVMKMKTPLSSQKDY